MAFRFFLVAARRTISRLRSSVLMLAQAEAPPFAPAAVIISVRSAAVVPFHRRLAISEAVIGLHFFSPANVMRLLEIVRADKTSKEVIATSMAVAKKIGKIAVLVGVCPGFVGNRILGQRGREAQKLVMEGAMPFPMFDQKLKELSK